MLPGHLGDHVRRYARYIRKWLIVMPNNLFNQLAHIGCHHKFVVVGVKMAGSGSRIRKFVIVRLAETD